MTSKNLMTYAIVFGSLSVASLGVLCWSALPLTMAWNELVLGKASAAVNVASFVTAYTNSLWILFGLVAIHWIKTGMWSWGVAFALLGGTSAALLDMAACVRHKETSQK